MTDAFHRRIRQVDPAAVPGAPDPASLLSGDFWTKVSERRERRRRQSRRGTAALVGVAALAVVVGLGLALAPPEITSPRPSAAATALRTIADNTKIPLPGLPTGTWLHRTMDFSVVSPTTTLRSASFLTPITTIHRTSARSVTMAGVLDSWVSGTVAVESATFQSPQFGSPRRQAAWRAAGLLTSPVAGTHPILSGAAHNSSNGLFPVKVTGLPKTAAKLAKALRTGRTGVPSLDASEHRRSPEAPFERAVLLLLSPTVGVDPGFPAEVYRAVALLPHVVSLGRVWTHTGQTGQGFAVSNSSDAMAIIVNRKGALLEVRNLRLTTWRESLSILVATAFCPTRNKAESIDDPPLVNQLYFTISWIDPVGTPTPVSATAVPTPLSRPSS